MVEFIVLGVGVFLVFSFGGKRVRRIFGIGRSRKRFARKVSKSKTLKPFKETHSHQLNKTKFISGNAYVVDGDTICINSIQIRLHGIDAPEIDHPYGKKAKWALVAICKNQRVNAEILSVDDYGRTVAICTLEDGTDVSQEMVKLGMALDWEKFSGGLYRQYEPVGVRKKLWLADARQKGRLHVWQKYTTNQNTNS